jgi:hypothetical protein
MTWLWRIFFSGVCLIPLWGADVTGSVMLVDSRDPAVRRHKDFSGVAVWLEPAEPRPTDPRPSGGGPPPHSQMIQKDKRFLPHVLAISAGTPVDFPNLDPIFHNAFSNYSGQIFDVGLYQPGTSRTVVFKRPGIVRVFCNIHPTMSAVIAVVDSPWLAVSKSSGGVPPAAYQLHVFHERATEETLNALVRAVTVEQASLALPAITIPETGYIPAPHQNKYGKDYPPVIDGQPVYSPKL